MIIFQGPKKKIIFIHIPKNSGRYIRECIKKKYKVLYSFWDVGQIDRAHIPYSLRNIFIKQSNDYRYITFVRNPYDRFISAFKYKYPNASIQQMNYFAKTILPDFIFDKFFNPKIIHFFPQYMFLMDENNKLNDEHKKIEVKKLENCDKFDLFPMPNFKVKKYNYKEYLDSESIEMINKIYKQDFESFNYPIITYLTNT